ncbi:MAG: hypothetical protein L6R41_005323 [Letrouitia leprolyta]|nr:MAG: hypothetical protein L6R41_005323 [Letrouitia leprolyta]
MKTRKLKALSASKAETETTPAVPKPESDPVKLLLLPSQATPGARICTLAHPATSKPCRYYFCPKSGMHEFQGIAVPKRSRCSWLLGPRVVVESEGSGGDDNGVRNDEATVKTSNEVFGNHSSMESINGVNDTGPPSRSITQGRTVKEPELLVATPIDLLFLMIPSLYTQVNKSAKGLFLSLDDLLEEPSENSKHFKHVLESEGIQSTMEARMAAVCDTVEVGDEKMYRLNMDKLVAELVAKAKRMTATGLPASMESKFVSKALETPILVLKRAESSVSLGDADSVSQLESQSASTTESQSTSTTSDTVVSDISAQTEITVPDLPPQPTIPNGIRNLLRIRTALLFIITSYLPPPLASAITTILSSTSSPIDFTPLDTHLNHISKLRAEAQASRSLSDFSRKRSFIDDDEAAEEKVEKKRRKEEEDKRLKASQTKGIRDLKKVNVSGMKKMSDFFGKKPAVKK